MQNSENVTTGEQSGWIECEGFIVLADDLQNAYWLLNNAGVEPVDELPDRPGSVMLVIMPKDVEAATRAIGHLCVDELINKKGGRLGCLRWLLLGWLKGD